LGSQETNVLDLGNHFVEYTSVAFMMCDFKF